MVKSRKAAAARPEQDPRANPLLPHGVPTAAEVDEFLDVMAFAISRALVSPSLLRLMALGEQAKATFGRS